MTMAESRQPASGARVESEFEGVSPGLERLRRDIDAIIEEMTKAAGEAGVGP